jgi:hypothetical protein
MRADRKRRELSRALWPHEGSVGQANSNREASLLVHKFAMLTLPVGVLPAKNRESPEVSVRGTEGKIYAGWCKRRSHASKHKHFEVVTSHLRAIDVALHDPKFEIFRLEVLFLRRERNFGVGDFGVGCRWLPWSGRSDGTRRPRRRRRCLRRWHGS